MKLHGTGLAGLSLSLSLSVYIYTCIVAARISCYRARAGRHFRHTAARCNTGAGAYTCVRVWTGKKRP
jgi:hypothetical protein